MNLRFIRPTWNWSDSCGKLPIVGSKTKHLEGKVGASYASQEMAFEPQV